MPLRVDMEALRREHARRLASAEPETGLFSRRDVLNTAGLATAGFVAAGLALPAVRSLAMARKGLRVQRQGEAAVFLLDGREVWRIDPSLFDGSPVVHLLPAAKGQGAAGAELRGARYPGTSLALRFRAVVVAGKDGYRLSLQFVRCGAGRVSWKADAPFEAWLAGGAPVVATVSARQAQSFWGPSIVQGVAVHEAGSSPRQILFDRALALTVAGACEVRGLWSTPLKSASVSVAPLRRGAPSVASTPDATRSLITVTRGDQTWVATLDHVHGDGWALRADGHNLFEAVRVEAGESGYVAAFQPAEQPSGRMTFELAPGLGGLALDRPLLVVAKGRDGDELGLVSDFAERAGWIRSGMLAVELGTAAGTAPLQMHATPACTHALACVPAVRTLIAATPDAIAVPVDYRGTGVHLSMATQGAESAPSASPAATLVPVIRPLPRPSIVPILPARATPTPVPMIHPTFLPIGPAASATPTLVPVIQPTSVPILPTAPPTATTTSHIQPIPRTTTIPVLKPTGTPNPPPHIVTVPFTAPVELVRPDDLLVLRFRAINLSLRSTTGGEVAALHRTDPNKDAYLVVYFPPQHVGERAYHRNQGDTGTGDEGHIEGQGPTRAMLAGWSRLAFKVPAGINTISYTLESLLDWSKFTLSVAPVAVQSLLPIACGVVLSPKPVTPTAGCRVLAAKVSIPSIEQPKDDEQQSETALEVPFRLILSPHEQARWAHVRASAQHGGVTELWHTRLGVPGTGTPGNPTVDERTATYRTMRAIWSPDRTDPQDPYLMSLTSDWRRQLVSLMATRRAGTDDTVPLAVNQLMLSALGAWINVHGHWDPSAYAKLNPPLSLSLSDWRHVATMGRDQYVRVVTEGILLPFGHRAALITISQRDFVPQGHGLTAFLQQRQFLIVRDPLKTFGLGDMYDGRKLPYRSVRIKTSTTPDLDPHSPDLGPDDARAFYPYVQGSPFPFHLEGLDWTGRSIEWTQALAFIDGELAGQSGMHNPMVDVIKKFNWGADTSETTPNRRCRSDLNGQKVAYADPAPGQAAIDKSMDVQSTTFPSQWQTFLVYAGSKQQYGVLSYYPYLYQASIQSEALSNLAGNGDPITVRYADPFLEGSPGVADVILQVAPGWAAPKVGFSGGQAGGLAMPTITFVGFSRTHGPVGGTATPANGAGGAPIDPSLVNKSLGMLAAGTFSPRDFLDGSSTILGSIHLVDVLDFPTNPNPPPRNLDKAPRIKTSLVYLAADGKTEATQPLQGDAYKPPIAARTTLTWRDVPLKESSDGLFLGTGGALSVDGTMRTDLATGQTTSSMIGRLTNFSLNLLPVPDMNVIEIDFASLEFTTATGQKPTFTPSISQVKFTGVLQFVEVLSSFLSTLTGGGTNKTSLSARPSGPPQPSVLMTAVRAAGGGDTAAAVPAVLDATPAELWAADSQANGPSLEITPSGITAGFALTVPNLGFGLFSLTDIRIAASVTLPFSAGPVAVDFAFSRRDNPFLLAVYGVTGGGFLHLRVAVNAAASTGGEAPTGLTVEGALEFGGSLSLDLVVASGRAYLMAGIYFLYDTSGDSKGFTIEGYVRCGGGLSILGLVSVSVEFYLGLAYESGDNSVYGECSLKLEIHILFFSTSVEVGFSRRFGGSSSTSTYIGQDVPEMLPVLDQETQRSPAIKPMPPRHLALQFPSKFTDAMNNEEWQLYAGAFA